MTNIRIFDDQYWWIIYKKLSPSGSGFTFPIKGNVASPIPFLDKIKDWDIILLDNYFPWETWEEPLWDTFLQMYLDKWLNCKIICISDYWKVLLDKYVFWNLVNEKWDIIWWVTSKNAKEILSIINSKE